MVIAWVNFAVLIFSTLFFLYFYILSVSPAALECLTGPGAYERCGRYRVVAMVFEFITIVNYIVYYFFPLPTPLPERFSWTYWLSVAIGLMIALPAGSLMVIGMVQAGEEAARPRKEHQMYSGIYEKIRHPQAAGEVFLWWAIAFFLHSPFLVLFSFVYLPVFLLLCWAEEHDLVLRFGDAYIEYYRRTGAFWPKSN
jgi:protein-S-isoprenylcysteine O-methyltransferase Ste14